MRKVGSFICRYNGTEKNDELTHKFRLDRDTLKNHRLGCFNFLVLTVEMTYSAVTRRHKRTKFRAPRLNPHLSRLCLPVSASQPHTSTSTTILPSEVSTEVLPSSTTLVLVARQSTVRRK